RLGSLADRIDAADSSVPAAPQRIAMRIELELRNELAMFVGETPLSNSPFSVFAQPFELHDAQVTPAKAAIHAGLRDYVENAFRGPGIGDRAIGPICAFGKCLVARQTGKRAVDDQLGICDPYVVHQAVAVVKHQATLGSWP